MIFWLGMAMRSGYLAAVFSDLVFSTYKSNWIKVSLFCRIIQLLNCKKWWSTCCIFRQARAEYSGSTCGPWRSGCELLIKGMCQFKKKPASWQIVSVYCAFSQYKKRAPREQRTRSEKQRKKKSVWSQNKFEWLNLSFYTYKIRYKKLFLTP